MHEDMKAFSLHLIRRRFSGVPRLEPVVRLEGFFGGERALVGSLSGSGFGASGLLVACMDPDSDPGHLAPKDPRGGVLAL